MSRPPAPSPAAASRAAVRRRALPWVALSAALAAALAGGGPSFAQDDPRRDALLLYVDGKFDEAETLLAKAGKEVANDAGLRAQLADAAQRALRSKQGEDRRPALVAIRRCAGLVAALKPDDAKAVAGAVAAARELAALDLAANQKTGAKSQAQFAIEIAEKAPAGALDAATKFQLAETYGIRAAVNRGPDVVDDVCADYERAVKLYLEVVGQHGSESECLARAARMRLDAARFVRDMVPVPEETRDETFLAAALELATRACESKGAAEPTFAAQMGIGVVAHAWKLPGPPPRVFTSPLAPPYEGIKIEVPRGPSWKVGAKTPEWDVVLERKLEDEYNVTVQVTLTARAAKSTIGGKAWSQLEDAAKTQYGSCLSSFTEGTNVDTPPGRLGGKKSDLWWFEVGGMRPDFKRPQRIVEFIWPSTTRKDTVWDLRVVDWRRPSSIDDPDIAAVVASAIGPGLWPPGAAPAQPEDPKKKPKKK